MRVRSARRWHSGIVAIRARGLVGILALAPTTPLRNPLDRTRRLLERVVLIEPFSFEHGLRIGVAIDLAGVSLAATTGADALALPDAAGNGRAFIQLFVVEVGGVRLLGADEQTADDGDDARNRSRHGHRVLRLLVRLDPTRKLDDSFADRADVDRALAEYRVATKGAKHTLLERRIAFGIRRDVLALVEFVVVCLVEVVVRIRRMGSRRCLLAPMCERLEPLTNAR